MSSPTHRRRQAAAVLHSPSVEVAKMAGALKARTETAPYNQVCRFFPEPLAACCQWTRILAADVVTKSSGRILGLRQAPVSLAAADGVNSPMRIQVY